MRVSSGLADAGRHAFFGGVAIGRSSVIVPLYIVEIVPPAMRGRLVAMSLLNIDTYANRTKYEKKKDLCPAQLSSLQYFLLPYLEQQYAETYYGSTQINEFLWGKYAQSPG